MTEATAIDRKQWPREEIAQKLDQLAQVIEQGFE